MSTLQIQNNKISYKTREWIQGDFPMQVGPTRFGKHMNYYPYYKTFKTNEFTLSLGNQSMHTPTNTVYSIYECEITKNIEDCIVSYTFTVNDTMTYILPANPFSSSDSFTVAFWSDKDYTVKISANNSAPFTGKYTLFVYCY